MLKEDEKFLIVIPARGQSKEIPRKNLRLLRGKPLMAYSIENALSLNVPKDVVVSSDDDEILSVAHDMGAAGYKQPEELSHGNITLDKVVYHYYQFTKNLGRKYRGIITMQLTSPLLSKNSIEKGIERYLNTNCSVTVLSVVDNKCLEWGVDESGKAYPLYKSRVNRQWLPKKYRETGGFVICSPSQLDCETRFGKNVELIELEGKEAIDIDGFDDWFLCEYYFSKGE